MRSSLLSRLHSLVACFVFFSGLVIFSGQQLISGGLVCTACRVAKNGLFKFSPASQPARSQPDSVVGLLFSLLGMSLSVAARGSGKIKPLPCCVAKKWAAIFGKLLFRTHFYSTLQPVFILLIYPTTIE